MHTHRHAHRLTRTQTHTLNVLSGSRCLDAARSANPHAPLEAPSTLGCRSTPLTLSGALLSDSSRVSSPVAVSGHPQPPPPAPAGPLPSPRTGVSVSPSPHVEYGQGPGGSSDASALTVLGLGSWHGGPGDLGPGLSQRPGLSRFHPLPLSGSLPAVPVRTGDSPGPPGGPRISAAPPPPTPSTPSQTPHL